MRAVGPRLGQQPSTVHTRDHITPKRVVATEVVESGGGILGNILKGSRKRKRERKSNCKLYQMYPLE